MTPIDNKLIEQVTRAIVEGFQPRRIVLFGSHARGDAAPGSDLDIMVEMETPNSIQQAIEISRALGSRDWPMDIVVYTPEQVRRNRDVVGTLVSMIEEESKVLYERPEQ